MVKEILFHPEYSPQRIFNNLAIIITESNFVYQKHIGPVCLPRPNENFEGQVNILIENTFRLSNLFFNSSPRARAGPVAGGQITRALRDITATASRR